jgi:hypothetical protein
MRYLCLVAMLVPPWNVLWWTVGLVLYTFARATGDDDASGDGFLYVVLSLR